MLSCNWIRSGIYCTLLCFSCITTPCTADETDLDSGQAQTKYYIQAALEAEAEGDFARRQLMLASASACGKDCETLQIALGLTRNAQGEWMSIDECVERLSKKPDPVVAYEKWRENLPDSLVGNLRLATVALRYGLLAQSRAHFERALDFDSDNVPARQALGYQLLQGEWFSPADIFMLVEQGKKAQSSIDRFGEKLVAIRIALSNRSLERRVEASDSLFQISNPDAIPAAISIFANTPKEVASTFVRWLGKHADSRATLALARYSFEHPIAEVRLLATRHLKGRPLHDYVHFVLESVSSPITMTTIPVFSDGTLVGYRQAFAREAADKTDIFVIDTAVQRRATPLLLSVPSEDEAEGSWITVGPESMPENRRVERGIRTVAGIETQNCRRMTVQQNYQINERNDRAAELLSRVTGEELPSDPDALWKWWDEYNETEYQLYKPVRNRRATRRHEIPLYVGVAYSESGGGSERFNAAPQANFSGPQFGSGGGLIGGECFAEGTPVLTAYGPRRIEALRVGDIVFCKNIATGEIVRRPILRSTTRPPRETLLLKAGKTEVQCTLGHLFWVSGDGWRKASELRRGDILNTAGTPAIVESVSPMPKIRTFNLEVADFRNYFVGQERLLSHDVTPRRSEPVPGSLVARNK